MNIVIAGAGEVGANLAMKLRQDGHNVALIEKSPEACRRVENLDVLVVEGSAADPDKLNEAGVENADYFIGVTGSDEVNLIGCTFARFREVERTLQSTKLEGAEELKKVREIKPNSAIKTLARVNSFELMENAIEDKKFRRLGVDLAFCPDLLAARNIANLLLTPSLFNTKIFTESDIRVMEAEIRDSTPVVGMSLEEISDKLNFSNIVLLYRESDVIIPTDKTQFLPGDRVLILLLKNERLNDLEEHFGKGLRQVSHEDAVKRVIILGATKVGIKLATLLKMDKSEKRQVTLIDKNPSAIEEANRIFTKLGLNINVIMGRGTDVSLLRDNRIEKTDAFVAVTYKEQTNIISCLLAKKLGATYTVAVVEQEALLPLLESMSIDTVVNTKLSAVSSIFPHIISRNIQSLSIIEGGASMLELKVSRKAKINGRPLSSLPIPPCVKLGALIRGKQAYIPDKKFEIKSGDRLILFGKENFYTKMAGYF